MPYLDTFTGEWNAKNARHLLKRCSFGITPNLIKESVTLGLQGTINKLFEVKSLPNPPLKYELDGTSRTEVNDPDVN